jgi:hypothetical protein
MTTQPDAKSKWSFVVNPMCSLFLSEFVISSISECDEVPLEEFKDFEIRGFGSNTRISFVTDKPIRVTFEKVEEDNDTGS